MDIPHCHHEKWDGTGYPRGLAGEEIPLAARIFTAVDIWDALTHDRPYRGAWSADRARAHLRSLSGSHLDPVVVEAFLRLPVVGVAGALAEPAEPGPIDAGRAARPGPGIVSPRRYTDALRDPTRLAALRSTGLMDSPAEHSFDRLVQLASKILGTPIALISLIDEHRQFFKSSCGLSEPWSSGRETPLTHSFCQHVVRNAAPLIINDARIDPRVRDNLAVAELGVVAYAGMPLWTAAGLILGSFCVIDVKPRSWAVDELEVLSDLAALVMTEIELRGDIAARRRVELELRLSRRRVAEQLGLATRLNCELDAQRLEMARADDLLATRAATDGLTGLENRHSFDRALPAAHHLAATSGKPLSVILADVDDFK